jgi:hypothetical protein
MINKSFILNKVIENVKNDYQLAVAQHDSANIQKHQNNLVGILTLKNQLEQAELLNENNVQTPPSPHTPPTPPSPHTPPTPHTPPSPPNKGGNK